RSTDVRWSMLAGCGPVPGCVLTSTTTSLDADDDRIPGANDPGAPFESTAALPRLDSADDASVSGVGSLGMAMTLDDPSGPITIVVSSACGVKDDDATSCDVVVLHAATTSSKMRKPPARGLVTWR